MQFMQAEDPTVEKFLDLESNLCGIEGLPTCNLDRCKVSYFFLITAHSFQNSHESLESTRLLAFHPAIHRIHLSGSQDFKSMAWVI